MQMQLATGMRDNGKMAHTFMSKTNTKGASSIEKEKIWANLL